MYVTMLCVSKGNPNSDPEEYVWINFEKYKLWSDTTYQSFGLCVLCICSGYVLILVCSS